jgi:hypothetical protein
MPCSLVDMYSEYTRVIIVIYDIGTIKIAMLHDTTIQNTSTLNLDVTEDSSV